MRYRSRTDIICQILEAANGNSATRSKMMYKAFLSYSQMKEYLTVLTANHLLSYDQEMHTFKTTEKGLRFLEIYNQIGDVMKALQ
jgi:predicted transcriptional regulator